MESKNRIWLVGKTGRIGESLLNIFLSKDNSHEFIATNKEEIDITDLKAVEKFVEKYRPNTIINCATKREKIWCEKNKEEAFKINSLGARNLAIASLQTGAHLIHISTDYVFDGMIRKSYKEYNATNPINEYGKSMRFAEELILQMSARHTIIRASRLYGKRLITSIIKEARETGKVYYDAELITTPISILSLAELVYEFIDTSEYGTFHFGSSDIANAWEFIKAILKYSNIKAELIESDDLRDIVQRPKHLVFSRTMLKLIGKDKEINWEDDLKRFMEYENIK